MLFHVHDHFNVGPLASKQPKAQTEQKAEKEKASKRQHPCSSASYSLYTPSSSVFPKVYIRECFVDVSIEIGLHNPAV